jgi:hypothetical protein
VTTNNSTYTAHAAIINLPIVTRHLPTTESKIKNTYMYRERKKTGKTEPNLDLEGKKPGRTRVDGRMRCFPGCW